jgi:hypothetical protein
VHIECEDVRDAILEDEDALDVAAESFGIGNPYMDTEGTAIVKGFPKMVIDVCETAT